MAAGMSVSGPGRLLRLGVTAVAGVLLVGAMLSQGGSAGSDLREGAPSHLLPDPPADLVPDPHAGAPMGKLLPLRAGEKRMTLTMPTAYTPSAPTGVGTDDYRCFVLDPGLDKDVWLTGSNVLPDNRDAVHHVILFRVDPRQVAEAEDMDAATPGEGWTCFGGTGLSGDFSNVDDANWLGAWAPGGDETRTRDGYGTRLEAGSRIIMQVHYNLLKGDDPDRSSTQLRWMSTKHDLTALHTFLMPAPVELPCRPSSVDSPLCDRDAALADVKARFGDGPGSTADLLYFLCGGKPVAAQTTSCTRYVQRPMTIIGVAGHMHLLGRKITIETNPGTPEARTILDIPVWDFDNQGAHPIKAVHLDPFDTVKVTCTHQQWLRDRLPAFSQAREDRYVVWGEGTTDEMCLGMLQVAFD
jgi:hypothetical protein